MILSKFIFLGFILILFLGGLPCIGQSTLKFQNFLRIDQSTFYQSNLNGDLLFTQTALRLSSNKECVLPLFSTLRWSDSWSPTVNHIFTGVDFGVDFNLARLTRDSLRAASQKAINKLKDSLNLTASEFKPNIPAAPSYSTNPLSTIKQPSIPFDPSKLHPGLDEISDTALSKIDVPKLDSLKTNGFNTTIDSSVQLPEIPDKLWWEKGVLKNIKTLNVGVVKIRPTLLSIQQAQLFGLGSSWANSSYYLDCALGQEKKINTLSFLQSPYSTNQMDFSHYSINQYYVRTGWGLPTSDKYFHIGFLNGTNNYQNVSTLPSTNHQIGFINFKRKWKFHQLEGELANSFKKVLKSPESVNPTTTNEQTWASSINYSFTSVKNITFQLGSSYISKGFQSAGNPWLNPGSFEIRPGLILPFKTITLTVLPYYQKYFAQNLSGQVEGINTQINFQPGISSSYGLRLGMNNASLSSPTYSENTTINTGFDWLTFLRTTNGMLRQHLYIERNIYKYSLGETTYSSQQVSFSLEEEWKKDQLGIIFKGTTNGNVIGDNLSIYCQRYEISLKKSSKNYSCELGGGMIYRRNNSTKPFLKLDATVNATKNILISVQANLMGEQYYSFGRLDARLLITYMI